MLQYCSHIRVACLAWLLLALGAAVPLHAQDTTAHALGEVLVESGRLERVTAGKKTQQLDSLTLALYGSSSLSELLSTQSTIHVKQYGNGNIATTSFRGGNAGQTALLWNGINIQNNMLGQSDLSLINSILFDEVELEFGSSSALWGNGAMGGSIHLNNKPRFGQGTRTKLNLSVGSFGTNKISTGILLSGKKLLSNTKVYYTDAKNNYTYKDTLDKEHPDKRAEHADYTFKGLLQELSALIGSYQKISLRGWYNENQRNLPVFTGTRSTRSQEDKNLKLNAEWNYNRRGYTTAIRGAYLRDILNYTDSTANLFSKSESYSVVAENEHYLRYKSHTFHAGANYTHYGANTANYLRAPRYDKLAFFLSHHWKGFNDRLSTGISLRQEFSSQYTVPFTGNIGAEYVLQKWISLKINGAKSFRQPTLNDLYWNPGGNPDLKPEEALGFEGGIVLNKTIGRFSFWGEGTYFNRHTTNWIIWLPFASYTSPRNIAKVYSRGTETNFYVKYVRNEWLIKLSGLSAYVLSTNEQLINENDASNGRQLIYTPRYSIQGGLLIGYDNFSILYNHSYTGYRFTSTDNLSWLPPYHLGSLRATYGFGFDKVRLQVFLAANNLYNTNYQVIVNMPMALRQYEAGLSLQYNKQPKK